MASNRQVLKVAVVGGPRTGKSSLIARYVGGRFLRHLQPKTEAGADFSVSEVTVNQKKYLYQIWDVSGKAGDLPSLGSAFWEDVCGCLLLYDVTSASSFSRLGNLLEKIQQECVQGDVPVIVVGSKVEDGRESTQLREVGEEVEEWCRGRQVVCNMEASAKSGYEVDSVFQTLAEEAVVFYNHRQQESKLSELSSHSKPALHSVVTGVYKLFKDRRLKRRKSKNSKDMKTSGLEISTTSRTSRSYDPSLLKNAETLESSDDYVWEEVGVRVKEKASEREEDEIDIDFSGERKKTQDLLKKVAEQEEEIRDMKRSLESRNAKLTALQQALDQKTKAMEEMTKNVKQLKSQQKATNASSALDYNPHPSYSQLLGYDTSVAHLEPAAFWEVPRGDIELDMTRIVGTGAWGYVVEGVFRRKRVAVKCLHELIRHPRFLQAIRREIDIMASVRHPNLVLFMGVVLDEEAGPMIITELLETSLRRAYEQNILQRSSILSILMDVALALNYLHLLGEGIIHRDVSSANVLLEAKPEGQWRAKLSDFGSANLIRQSSTMGPGAIVYSAPEVKAEGGGPQTPEVDVYSFGVLLCEVLLFQFPTIEQLQEMLEAVGRKWPCALQTLAVSCTQYCPEHRPTMAEVVEILNEIPIIG